MVVNDRLFLGDESTGFYISPYGTIASHGQALIFNKEQVDDTGYAAWGFLNLLRKGGDFVNLTDGPNPELMQNCQSSRKYCQHTTTNYPLYL
jgi:hypothetical protein